MKYLLDFDRTLFDTDRFVAQVASDKKTNILLTPQIWQFYSARDFLYDDVLSWLKSKPKESLYIVTAMSPEAGPQACSFQKAKLESSGIGDFVSDIIYMVGEKGPHVQTFVSKEATCFVDDLPAQHVSVQKHAPGVHSFLMDRSVSMSATKAIDSNIHLVRNLAEVDAIIEAI